MYPLVHLVVVADECWKKFSAHGARLADPVGRRQIVACAYLGRPDTFARVSARRGMEIFGLIGVLSSSETTHMSIIIISTENDDTLYGTVTSFSSCRCIHAETNGVGSRTAVID